MSILLIVMLLLAVFHYFYQSVIVKTNNELHDIDVNILKHEVDIYEIKNSYSFNVSEKELFEDTKSFVSDCSKIGKNVTFVELVSDIGEIKKSKDYDNNAQRIRSFKVMNPEIWKFNSRGARLIAKNLVLNAAILVFFTSPVFFLIMCYSWLSGNKFSIEKRLERIATKHC